MAGYQARGAARAFSAENTGFNQGLGRVVGLRDGGFGVTFISADQDRTVSDGDLLGLTFDLNAVPSASQPVRVIDNTGPTNSYPVNQAVTELSNGGFAVLSTDNARINEARAGQEREVALRLLGADGSVNGQACVSRHVLGPRRHPDGPGGRTAGCGLD